MAARARAFRLARRIRARIEPVLRWFRSPLVRILPLSALLMLAIGISVHRVTTNVVTTRYREQAEHEAEMFASYAVVPPFAGVPQGPLDQPTIDRITAAIGASRPKSGLVAITLLGADGVIRWADDASTIGRHRLPPAPSGRIHSRVIVDGGTLETSVPVGQNDEIVATMQAYTPYRPIVTEIATDVRESTAMLIGGLLVLYAVLLPVLMRAHGRLRRHASTQEHLAVHDPLTGLANRALLLEEATRAMSRARRRGTHMALLVIDLDKFKEVNDTLGHHTGDALLKQVAERLHAVVRDSDLLSRTGGDEFAVLADDIALVDGTKILAQRLLTAMLEPFTIEDLDLDVGASIGAAVYPDDGDDVDTLMQHADSAMYRAKTIRNAYAMYHSSQDGIEPERLTLVSSLRTALDHNEVVLHYQPKIDVDSGLIVGVEALARWEHPERGLLPPSEFLEAVEATGLMPIFSDFVLDRALGQCRTWLDAGMSVPVAVNVSARSLDDAYLHDKVVASLAKWQLPASYLELEFSETTVMHDVERVSEMLGRLSALGVRVAVDEFGTSYSSLTRLQQLPLSTIKIDRSFLADIEHDDRKQTIVRTMINMAHDMGYAAIAVGTESADAWHLLQALECDAAQGFFFARPQPAAMLETLLRQHCPNEALAVHY